MPLREGLVAIFWLITFFLRAFAGGGNDPEVLSYIQGKRTNTSGWFSLKAHWNQLYEFERRLSKPHTQMLDFNFAVHLKRKSVISIGRIKGLLRLNFLTDPAN